MGNMETVGIRGDRRDRHAWRWLERSGPSMPRRSWLGGSSRIRTGSVIAGRQVGARALAPSLLFRLMAHLTP
jgi:hypothetical protein